VVFELVFSALLSDILIRVGLSTTFVALLVIFVYLAEVLMPRIFFFYRLKLDGSLLLFGSCFEQRFKLNGRLFLFQRL
jgi:hypothetical protein